MAKSRGEWEEAFAARISRLASRWPRTRDNIPPATQAIDAPMFPGFRTHSKFYGNKLLLKIL